MGIGRTSASMIPSPGLAATDAAPAVRKDPLPALMLGAIGVV